MEKKIDLIVYIGRFSPVHLAHIQTIQTASELAENVLVLIGSACAPRTTKNPWTVSERDTFMRLAAQQQNIDNLFIDYLRDYAYDDSQWAIQVGEKVANYAEALNAKTISVIGHDKDHSSFYLNMFPHWGFVEVPAYPEHGETIDATKIRNLLFEGNYAFIESVVPAPVFKKIIDFTKTEHFRNLKEDWQYVQAYKKSWAAAPFPPTFVTVDAVVVQSGHVLLIQRGAAPGKGMWAMPGGFIDPYEQLVDAAIRELREETRVKVPEKVLRGSIVEQEVFADPSRSTRGRTITHCYLFKLDDTEKLPLVKGSDDAAAARWFPLSDFFNMESEMFEDHFHIVNHMLNKL